MQRIQMRRVQNWNRLQISIGQNLSILMTPTELISLQIRYQCTCYVQRDRYTIALLFSILHQYTKRRQRETHSRTKPASKNESIQAQRAINAKKALCQLSKKVWHAHFSWWSALTKNFLVISIGNTFKDHIIVSLFHLVIMSIWWSMTWTPPCRPLTIIFIFLVASCSCWFWSSCSPMSPWNDELHRGQIYGNWHQKMVHLAKQDRFLYKVTPRDRL